MTSTPLKSRLLSLFFSKLTAPIAAVSAALSIASPAAATWSILITDTRTGEMALGSATCLTSLDLAISTPVVLTGIGAITAQSAVDINGNNRMFVRDRLLEGQPLSQILADLEDFDPGHDNRQYGMITASGQTLTYSGPDNADWAGGITGRIEQGRPGPKDDIVYTVQGNILSGPNVVEDAVQAIINTDADLPGKLMASMLAARIAGGDGRCSCSSANPTSCGSPPPGDFKSAHIGYMIGSRADDTDSIRAFYRLPVSQSVNSTSLTQLGNNQFAASDTAGNIHIYNNATNTNDQTAHFTFEQTIETNLPDLTNLTAADLDNNGLPDLIVSTNNTAIAVLLQTSKNTFDPPFLTNVNGVFPKGSISDIEPFSATNNPGDQILVAFDGGFATYNFTKPNLIQETLTTTASSHPAALLADINADGTQDFLSISILASDPTCRIYLGNTNGNFNLTDFVNTSDDPVQARAADINNDNLIDILVATSSSQVIDTFINTGTPESPTFAPRISSPLASGAIDFQITDLNNDNIQDAIVLLESGANLRYYLGDALGNFTETNRTRIGGEPTDALLADLNNDGDMDLITNASSQLLIYDNLQNATVQRQTGFARGDRFMFINIANQNSAAPDPVDQMLTRFDEFRESLAGKVDAVQSTATHPSRILIDDPAIITPVLRIELRDWQSNLITSPATFNLDFNPTNLTLSKPQLVAPGIYEFQLQALSENNANPGRHRIKIQATTTLDSEPFTVTLMPSITIPTTNSLADFNADGVHDFFDISIFLRAFNNFDPIADLNNDTILDTDDITLFINALKSAP